MGLKNGAYAKCWSVEPKTNTLTNVRLSINRKNKMTDEWEQDFSGFVMFIGAENAAKAAKIKEGDLIKIGNCDVSTRYDRDKHINYTNFKVFSFETYDEAMKNGGNNAGGNANNHRSYQKKAYKAVDDGEVDGFNEDQVLPF